MSTCEIDCKNHYIYIYIKIKTKPVHRHNVVFEFNFPSMWHEQSLYSWRTFKSNFPMVIRYMMHSGFQYYFKFQIYTSVAKPAATHDSYIHVRQSL